MKTAERITLTELQGLIRDKLYEALPGYFWVVAEIAEMKVNTAGHCYLELTGSDTPGGKVTSRARATIWASKFRSLNTFFTASTGIPLRAGITLLMKVSVEYHELYGLSLNISDLDPTYTAGEMALRREAIIRRLNEEGVMTMNRGLELPEYPRFIAVISSSRAAGYRDFVKHLLNNPFGYAFVPVLFEAVMQGEETEASVIDALDRVAGSDDEFDAAVIIRGGGSVTDLSWFDSYPLAYHVTQFPIPVLTGIGHEKDLSVTDMVAWKALKTPTAVADFLIEATAACENHILELAASLAETVKAVTDSAAEELASLTNRTAAAVRLVIRLKDEQIGHSVSTLSRLANTTIKTAREKSDSAERTLKHLDPARVLGRGFTLTTCNGLIIKSSSELGTGDDIITHFIDGTVKSSVTETSKKK